MFAIAAEAVQLKAPPAFSFIASDGPQTIGMRPMCTDRTFSYKF